MAFRNLRQPGSHLGIQPEAGQDGRHPDDVVVTQSVCQQEIRVRRRHRAGRSLIASLQPGAVQGSLLDDAGLGRLRPPRRVLRVDGASSQSGQGS